MVSIHKRRSKSVKITAIIISLLVVLAFLFASCGSGSRSYDMAASAAPQYNKAETYDMAPQEAPMPYPDEQTAYSEESGLGETTASNNAGSGNIMSQRKLIMDGDVSLETLNFDDSISALDKLVVDFGGFTEVRNVTGKGRNAYSLRTASYVIRIPAESFELVLKNMGSIGIVLESNSKGTDITDSYFDTQTRIKTLKVQEATLLDILSKAEKLEDVITLESRIAQVRYEIESFENTIRNYDRLVAFSRINIYIEEVDNKTETKPKPKTLGERLSTSFKGSLEDFKEGCEDFLVWFAGAWIDLIFIAILVVIGIFIYKRVVRSKITKAEKKATDTIPEKKE